MTEFAVEVRRYCRNSRCRSKLPLPVSNPREGFCARGCFNSFYLHRCLVPAHESLHFLQGNGAIVVGIHCLEYALVRRLKLLQ